MVADGEQTRASRGYIVTDAQVHIWASDSSSRPWPAEGHTYAHRKDAFGADELVTAMDQAGVTSAILVPPSFEGNYNDLVLAAAAKYPSRFAVMGRVDLLSPACRSDLESLAKQPAVLGIRLTFHRADSRKWLTDGTATWLWAELERYGLSAMVFAPGQNAILRDVALKHPGLRIVVDTLGLPLTARASDLRPAVRDILALADCGNVAVKASALPSFVTDPYPFLTLAPHVRAVVDGFGAARVFWASDLTRVDHPYKEIADFMKDLGVLSDAELVEVMGHGVREWLGWCSPADQR